MKSEAERQLKSIARELVRAARKARRRGKPKHWHRLRTTSRRLRGALLAFAPALAPALRSELDRRAKKITKLPAEVRDLDVAIEHLAGLREAVETRDGRKAAREMLGRLKRKRKRGQRTARRRLARKHPAQRLASRLKKALRQGGSPPRPGVPGDSLAEAAKEVLERRAAVTGWDDDQKLHELRVAVKKYRGALTAWMESNPGHVRAHRAALEGLHATQTVLGEHHDWSELARRLDARRLALANDGAGHRDLVGYESLLDLARREQKARHDAYLAQHHERLPEWLALPPEPPPPAPRRPPNLPAN
jgi:CHAD domain-containing protein